MPAAAEAAPCGRGEGEAALRFGGRKCMRIYGLNFYTSAHKAAAKLCANFLPCNAIAASLAKQQKANDDAK